MPGRGPEPVPVHGRDPGAAAGRCVELGNERLGLLALATEVVGRGAGVAAVVGRDAGGLEELVAQDDERVEHADALHEPGVTQGEVVQDDAAEVAANERAPVVPEHVVDERVQVERVRGHVVEAVGREVGVAVAAQVGRDDLEAGVGQRLDVAPPDALGLRVPVNEHDRRAAHALVHVGERHAVAHFGPLERERVRVGSLGHGGSLA